MNVKFEYLYRDSGNYKNFGKVICENKNRESIEKLSTQIRAKLLDELYFKAKSSHLLDLHFGNFDEELDHDWHEFEKITETDEPANDFKKRDIKDLINDLHMDIS